MIVGAAVLAALIPLAPLRLKLHAFELTTRFQNGRGLREGATIRVAGVDVGKVKKVRIRPELKDGPVEVVMSIATPYELRIPNDSLASLDTAGVLGETYVEINTAIASGPPVMNHGQLKSQETHFETSEELIQRLGDILSRRPCDCGTKLNPTNMQQHASNRLTSTHRP